jgi:hypothetical protein
MKLNLLPTYVSKEGQIRVAYVVSGLLVAASVAAAVLMTVSSNAQLDRAKQRVALWQPKYDQAVATSKRADEIMANSVTIDRNVRLAKAMGEHCSTYPNLYRQVLQYVPSWFRVTSITARPAGQQSTVTITGVLQTYQQYADVMFALLRIPDAVNVSRNGYALDRKSVPGLNEGDQIGTPVREADGNLPSDPMARMEELIRRANQAPGGFDGVGGFGTGEPQKSAMPGWSEVTLGVVLNRNIQTPNPRATLSAQGAAAPPSTPGGAAPGAAPGATPGGAQPTRPRQGDDL